MLIFYISILSLLILRLMFLQVFPSQTVINNTEVLQSEKNTDVKFKVLDTKGEDLLTYNKKYVLVFDKKPFTLNNYEETLQDLMALNFIMKAEDQNFNYTDIIKNGGKSYYDISKETYEKINKLNNLKGVYTYEYNERNKDFAWSIGNLIYGLDVKGDFNCDSLNSIVSSSVKDNEIPTNNYTLNEKSQFYQTESKSSNNNVKLTIDSDMSRAVLKVLNDDKYKFLKNIGVSIMESDTGKIRVMEQKDKSEPNINLCIEGSGYEPGSVFKIATIGAALDKGIVEMGDEFKCVGRICKHTIHSTLNVNEAFVQSCNDISAEIGREVGYDTLMDYAQKLGLYKPILRIEGEGMNESSGIKPKEEDGLDNISIGQCMTVTPVQILGFTNAIVNDGLYIKPYIVENIVDNENKNIKTFNSSSDRVFSSNTSKLLKKSMIEVVNRGTGVKAQVKNSLIGGKTGSATSASKTTHCWFTGFFTLNNKTYTMTVFIPDAINVDDERGGGDIAAPIFADIVNEMLK